MAIIAINNTQDRILIDDLGVFIDATSSVNLTEIFEKEDIASSKDLYDEVFYDRVLISDGTQTLSKANAFKHITIQTEWEDKDIIPPHGLGSHTDVYLKPQLDNQDQVYFDSTSHIWLAKPKEISTGTEPPVEPVPGDLWTPPNSNNTWVSSGDEWISMYRSIMTFSKGGNCDGEYLTIGGWVSADFYWFSGEGRICSVYSRSISGEDTKEFTFRDTRPDPAVDLFSFSYPGGGLTEYKDLNANISINADTLLKCFVSKAGSFVTDVLVQIEIAWRYIV